MESADRAANARGRACVCDVRQRARTCSKRHATWPLARTLLGPPPWHGPCTTPRSCKSCKISPLPLTPCPPRRRTWVVPNAERDRDRRMDRRDKRKVDAMVTCDHCKERVLESKARTLSLADLNRQLLDHAVVCLSCLTTIGILDTPTSLAV